MDYIESNLHKVRRKMIPRVKHEELGVRKHLQLYGGERLKLKEHYPL